MKSDFEHAVKLDGVTAFVFSNSNCGKRITVSGFSRGHRKFKPKDRVLFEQEDGSSSRYIIEDVQRPGDPPDQYFMDCKFHPRTAK